MYHLPSTGTSFKVHTLRVSNAQYTHTYINRFIVQTALSQGAIGPSIHLLDKFDYFCVWVLFSQAPPLAHRPLAGCAIDSLPALGLKPAFCTMLMNSCKAGFMVTSPARPATPGLERGQFAVRVPLPGVVLLPQLIVSRIADKVLADVVCASASVPQFQFLRIHCLTFRADVCFPSAAELTRPSPSSVGWARCCSRCAMTFREALTRML